MEQLIQRIQQEGDQKAFRELFLSTAPRLLSFAFVYVKNKFVAEEIVDDIFLHLWKNRDTLNEITSLDAYLYTGVKNRICNYFTRDRERRQISFDDVNELHLKVSGNPEQSYITAELQQILEKTINALPERCRLIFKMIKEDGFKHKEVANMLNISQKTVENQLTIAIKKIKQEVQLLLPEEINHLHSHS